MLIDDLRTARRSIGLSQRMLAERIGVDVQKIKRLEQGIGSLATLTAVMQALDFRLTGIGPGASLSEQLANRRRKTSLSIAHVADRSGLASGTVASIERGHGSVASLVKLMAVVTPNARRRSPERSYWGQADKEDRDSRFTPPEFLEHVYAAFGPIDLDPCAHCESPLVARRRIIPGEGGDGLTDAWDGRFTFVNPPFSALLVWLRRAHEQWRAGNVDTVVCLVPVRTDSAWFQQTLSRDADIYFLQGRLKFLSATGKPQHTPFSLMLVALGATAEQRQSFEDRVPGYWSKRQPQPIAGDVQPAAKPDP